MMKQVKQVAKVLIPYMGVVGYIMQNIVTKKYWFCPKTPMQVLYPTFDLQELKQKLQREKFIIVEY